MGIETMTKGKRVLATAASLAMVASYSGTAYATSEVDAGLADNEGVVTQLELHASQSTRVNLGVVEGVLGFSQGATASAEEIARAFRGSAYLCDGTSHESSFLEIPSNDSSMWSISVNGSVKNEFSTTFGAVAKAGNESRVIGCACAGNPAGGLAAVNAEVSGISVQRLIAAAAPENDANAVSFIAADGAKTTLPLWYVFSHGVIIADTIAGEPVSHSMGATVQLWVEGVPASCFVKDVVTIEVTCEDETPAVPTQQVDNSVLPNIAIISVHRTEA